MTVDFNNIYLNNYSIVGGPNLYKGPLKGCFDAIYKDYYDGESTFEDCEVKEAKKCLSLLLRKEKLQNEDINIVLGADLTNQLIISNLTLKDTSIPYFGLYNACASFSEELIIGSSLLLNKNVNNVVCMTSCNNLTAERQFRNPVEYGAPKPSYAGLTVSSATSCLISKKKTNIKIITGTIGEVIDLDIKDAFDMGSAMAPAAAKTLYKHLLDKKISPDYYDLILTGDLGKYGKEVLKKYMEKEYKIKLTNYDDSAVNVFDMNDKNSLAGGSGPSCLPTYFYTKIIPKMKENKIKRVLLLSTGALHSSTLINQKKSIPCICHAVGLEVVN